MKIAIMSNFTIIGLGKAIKSKCKEASISSEIYEAGYNQISQEIIGKKSGLKKFNPEISFIIFPE